MRKINIKHNDDFEYDSGPEFVNLEKNILDKVEVSLAFIFLLLSLFIIVSLLGYAGEIGNSFFELLTTNFGIYSYTFPIVFGLASYVIYYRKYKNLISKIFLFSTIIYLSIFIILNSFNLSGIIGNKIAITISQYIGEPLLLLISFVLTFISIISIFNFEKETIYTIKKWTNYTYQIILTILNKILQTLKKLINNFFVSRKNKILQNSNLENEIGTTLKQESAETKIPIQHQKKFSNLFTNFSNLFSKNKYHNLEKEITEEELESEEFKNQYDIEVDESGEGYISPKKKKNVHEELLEAASIKLSKEEKEKIRIRKIEKIKDDEFEKITINEYPEESQKPKKKVIEEYEEETVDVLEERYESPPLNLYEEDKGKPSAGDNKANAQTIKRTLQNFQISVEMDEVSVGPTVTRYTLKPAQGVKLSKIAGLDKNLAMDLSTTSIRIEAPIPGKSLVGIEIPNRIKATLGIGTLFGNPQIQEEASPLIIALGKDINGKPVFVPLSKMPHLLIAGTTGSGKSSTIHALIQSLIFKNSPTNLKFIMIDPKKVELSLYQKLPHLYTPVVKEPKKAVQVLNWLINEMERRYEVLESFGKVNIAGYHNMMHEKNAKIIEKNKKKDPADRENLLERMPYFVIVVDELADFMMAYPKEMESCIVRLAQKSRAVGIHLVLSTQRPSTNVITGVIKGNIPARVALKVVSQIDSRVILDTNGAEKLLGAGDMLFMNSDGSDIKRIQAPFVSEREIERVVDFLRNKYKEFAPQEIALPQNINIQAIQGRSVDNSGSDNGEELDERFNEAKDIVIQTKIASVTFLQRKMGIGYGRAARLIDLLEQKGIVGPQQSGSKPREVYGDAGSPLKDSDELPEDYDVEKDGYLV
jgi:S-DNA-T family DNA segregation ATPase FtsK/SpoIIIE